MRTALLALAALSFAASASAQQVADPNADLSVAAPAYAANAGPRVAIDAAHNNFHTVDGRYAPFAQLLRNDGFRVAGASAVFNDSSLADIDILVIANSLAAEDVEEWTLPNPSAFTADEIAALRRYVERGGALLLIADHMPFAGAAHDLAQAFGVSFVNGFADDGDQGRNADLFTRENGGLVDGPLTTNIRQVRNFTGSAFRAEGAGVRPLLRLDARWSVLTPEVAWQFSAETPQVPGVGLLQGAVLEAGLGRVAVFAEAAMFTAQLSGQNRMGLNAEGAEENKAFALAIAHWLAGAG